MPNCADHIIQARHNETFYDNIDKNAYSDWAMTALFYAALQYIDAFLATVGMVDPGGHGVRDQEINAQAHLRSIANLYFRLKNRSRNARYYCGRFSLGELERCRNQDLAQLRNHISPLIGLQQV